MQEDGTVTFEPMYECYSQPPLITKLFGLYLLFVLVLLLVRAVQIGLALRRFRKLQKQPGSLPAIADALWRDCRFKTNSLKRFATLTFLISLLTFTWSVSDILLNLRMVKTVNPAFILARIGDATVPLSMGLIFCTALYASAMLFESALTRRQNAFSASAPDTSLAASRLSVD